MSVNPNPTSGIVLAGTVIPYMGVKYPQTFRMRPRDVLARNLEKLMAATPGLSTFPQITAAGGGSNGTLDRIRRKQINTGVDNLAALGAAYGLQPWELLVPTLAPELGSEVRPVVKGTPSWPFASIPMSRFVALPEDARDRVELALKNAIEECELLTMSDAERRRFEELTKPRRKKPGTVKKAA